MFFTIKNIFFEREKCACLHSFLLLVGWNMDVMAKAPAAIIHHTLEVTRYCVKESSP